MYNDRGKNFINNILKERQNIVQNYIHIDAYNFSLRIYMKHKKQMTVVISG